jgi:hypothetical protein
MMAAKKPTKTAKPAKVLPLPKAEPKRAIGENEIDCADANAATDAIRAFKGDEVCLVGVWNGHPNVEIATNECGFSLVSLGANGRAVLRRA